MIARSYLVSLLSCAAGASCVLAQTAFAQAPAPVPAAPVQPPAPTTTVPQQPAPISAPAGDATQADSPIDEFNLGAALVQSSGLTAEQVAAKAVERSPQIVSAQAAATSAHWDERAAWTNFLPTIQLAAQYRRINEIKNDFGPGVTASPEQIAALDPVSRMVIGDLFNILNNPEEEVNFTQPLDSYALTASLRVPASDLFLRIWPAYEAQGEVADARKIQIEATEAQVAQQARDAFYTYARAVAAHVVQEQAVKQAEAQANQTRLFVEAGTSAPVDLMAATATLEGARGTLARAQAMVEVARNIVSTLSGIPRAEVTAISEPITELPEPPTASEEALVRGAFERRPELRAMRKVAKASSLSETAERNAAWPSLILEASDLYANPNPRVVPPKQVFRNSWEVGASLVWTPNQAISGVQRGNKQEAELAKARADLAALEDSVRIEVVQAYQDCKAADAVARSSEAQLKAAEEAYRVRMAMYQVGAGVRLDLIAADQQVTQARFQYASSAIDARAALSRLRRVAALD
jgi:outer membrane protein TolC